VLFNLTFDGEHVAVAAAGQPAPCESSVARPASAAAMVGRSFNMTTCALGTAQFESQLEAIHNNLTGRTWRPRFVER
jgi:hypothetical protein